MELLIGLGIVIVVLAVVLATHSDATPEQLSDAGLEAQIHSIQGRIQRLHAPPGHRPRSLQKIQQLQRYLAQLQSEQQQRQAAQHSAT